MPTTQEIMEQLESKNIGWIMLQFLDLDGKFREYYLNRENFSELHFSKGVEVGGVEEIFKENVKLKLLPNPSTYFEIPWADRTVKFLSKLYTNDGRFLKDIFLPLEKVKKQLSKSYESIGIIPSFSFHLFEDYSIDRNLQKRGPAVTIDTREGEWNPNSFVQKPSLLSSYPHDIHAPFRQQLAMVYEQLENVKVLNHYHGSSTAQQVFVLNELELEDAANIMIDVIYITKIATLLNGLYATFMPLPIPSEDGNSLKIKVAFYNKGENVFEDKEDKLGISQEAYYFVGGILEHIDSILVFSNAYTNSYKKFFRENYYISWGEGKGHAVTVKNGYIEIPFLDVNGFIPLSFAAIIGAGLDGIKNKISPPKYIEKSPVLLTSSERRRYKVKSFPRDLYGAIERLESDTEFLKSIIPPDLLVEYLERRLGEFKENSSMPTAYEFDKYF